MLELQSVFPSSTAPAVTSLATGCWPAEHGVPGWFTYLPDNELIAAILPFIERFSKRPLGELGVTPEMAFPVDSWLPRFERDALCYNPTHLVGSVYSNYLSGGAPQQPYEHLSAAVDAVAARIKHAAAPTYTYLYVPFIDAAEHDHGPHSKPVAKTLDLVQHCVANLAAQLAGRGRIVVSADHGLTHVARQNQAEIKDGDPLLDLLRLPPSSEPRVPLFYVRDGCRERFIELFHERFPAHALLTIDEVEELRLLGPEPLAPETPPADGRIHGHQRHPRRHQLQAGQAHAGLSRRPPARRGAHPPDRRVIWPSRYTGGACQPVLSDLTARHWARLSPTAASSSACGRRTPAASTSRSTAARRCRSVRSDDDVWSGLVAGIGPGARYRYRIDDRWGYPDPYSRSQPEGPHGPSEVVDSAAYAWRDGDWRGLSAKGLCIYELHVGAYTPEGTFDALAGQLDVLAGIGINAIELMPIAEFPGTRNWGYDGVDLFAPSHVYGGPDGLKRLVDAAHQRGIGVILDVVYNHLGPDGNYLTQFARDYFSNRHETRWGEGINYDGANCEMVRRFVIDNACYWLNEYHIDGLRIDAAFTIVDDSSRHILEELASTARASVPASRSIVMIAETYENDTKYVRAPADGGFGFDAVWADDFHHVVHAMASHERSGYYQDYAGTLDELARTINRGWLFEGQESKYLGALRGTSAGDLAAEHFVYCIDNHDQAANRAFGRRLSYLVGVEQHRAWSAVMLLLPFTPMIFMGQEFAASTGFYYFTDHGTELGEAIRVGRHAEFAAHEHPEEQHRRFPDPQDRACSRSRSSSSKSATPAPARRRSRSTPSCCACARTMPSSRARTGMTCAPTPRPRRSSSCTCGMGVSIDSSSPTSASRSTARRPTRM